MREKIKPLTKAEKVQLKKMQEKYFKRVEEYNKKPKTPLDEVNEKLKEMERLWG